jgi:hypothetical protein
MHTIHWVFTNDHKWHKEFDSESKALDFMYQCGFLLNQSIDRVWIESDNATLWLKEKSGV